MKRRTPSRVAAAEQPLEYVAERLPIREDNHNIQILFGFSRFSKAAAYECTPIRQIKAVSNGTRLQMKTRVTSKDPDLRGSLPALRRAARAARKRSRTLGSPFYVMQNGRIVDLNHKPRKSKTRKSA